MGKKRHVAIMFTDFKGFSRQEDQKYPAIHQLGKHIRATIIDPLQPLFVNTWGDAFYIVFEDCADAAEAALRLRDFIRTCNWRKWGLDPLQLRIGVHFGQATIMEDSGEVEDVVGEWVSAAARIEPIARPGSVFCSRIFHENLLSGKDTRFSGRDLGEFDLPKEFGRMHIFELFWVAESQDTPQPQDEVDAQVYFPQVPRSITDMDKRRFSNEAFAAVKSHFSKGAQASSGNAGGLHVAIRPISEMAFIAELYASGTLKHQMKIWHGGPYNDLGIACEEGRHLDPHSFNSHNEWLRVEERDGQLFLKAGMGVFGISHLGLDFDVEAMAPGQAAEYLWRRFVKNA